MARALQTMRHLVMSLQQAMQGPQKERHSKQAMQEPQKERHSKQAMQKPQKEQHSKQVMLGKDYLQKVVHQIQILFAVVIRCHLGVSLGR